MKNNTFAERMRQIMNDQKSVNDFSVKTGISASLLKAYLNGKSLPGVDNLLKIANSAGVRTGWLAEGEAPMLKEEAVPYIANAGFGEDYDLVNVVSGRSGAGPGFLPDDSVEMRIAFRRDWLQRKGDPRRMSLIRIQGDSMEPTLKSGDLVMVNLNLNYLDPSGGIYVITVDDHVMTKRIQMFTQSAKVKIISDNEVYETVERHVDDVIVNGRVVWFAREMER